MSANLNRYVWMVVLYVSMIISFTFNWGTYDSEIQKTIYLIAPLIALYAGYYALKGIGLSGAKSKVLKTITLALLLWFIGELIFLYLDMNNLEPSPSPADFFFLAGYPIFLLAIAKEKRIFKLKLRDLKTQVKIALAFISLGIAFITIYLGYFVAFDPTADFLTNVLGISWSLGDLMLGIALIYVVAMSWEFRSGVIKNTWISLLLWSTVNLIADTFFGIFPENVFDGSTMGIVLDALWISAYFFIAYYFFETRHQIETLSKKFLPQA
jgi:hypothetical protein